MQEDETVKTAKGTECNGKHEFSLSGRGMDLYKVRTIEGRRYTVCAHQVGRTYCGALIDVTDLPAVVICCGEHSPESDEQATAYSLPQ